MSFLSATLLLGTLAAGVPVVLHLLARQPPRRVVFPAVSFLKQRLTTQSSRLRVRRWWLLALRVLAIIAFAIVLARPHIDMAMSSQWITTGLLLLFGVGLLSLASMAFARGLAQSLVWSLLVAAILLGSIGGIMAVRALASGTRLNFEGSGPTAIAIVIDNSPSSAWRIDDDFVTASTVQTSNEDEELLNQQGQDLAGTRLAVALARAGELIEGLAGGSRVAIVDRSVSPAGFSLDPRAAQARLDRITPHAVPRPIDERIIAAVELVRTSDLPHRQVVVISDMAAPSWDENAPESSDHSSIAPAQHEGVPIRILNIHEDAEFNEAVASDHTAPTIARAVRSAPLINPWISPPEVADVAPSPGTAIAIRLDVGVWNGSEMGSGAGSGAASGSEQALTATVQLRLYGHDPALPVIRDGKIVLPSLRTVDRASVELAGDAGREVSLTLPPLARGTHHAVVELIGRDRFLWDNKRFITVELPAPPHVLMVGEHRDEASKMAFAMTAPHTPKDASASYRIETVSYRDLGTVDWNQFDLIMMIDPPVQFNARQQTIAGSSAGISTAIWNGIAGVVLRGGGLVIGLGPGAEVIGAGGERSQGRGDASPVDALIPPLVRAWRVPSPGTYWQVTAQSHPIFSALMRPASMPNWSDFRIHRYWQVRDESDESDSAALLASASQSPPPWDVIARYATSRDVPREGYPAVLTRRLGTGRIAVTTTPLPALGSKTRAWNDLFGAADAWPAFMSVRGLAAWAAGIDRSNTTILAGQAAVLDLGLPANDSHSDPRLNGHARDELDEERTVELYAPGQSTGRSIPVTQSSVLVKDTDTPGTYFIRSPEVWSGISANLSSVWSDGKTTSLETLQNWFGEEGWSIANDPSELSLQTNERAKSAVSLHGPLMLVAVLVFLAEQILSNRFYGSLSAPESE